MCSLVRVCKLLLKETFCCKWNWNGEEELSGREGVNKWSGNLWRELELLNGDGDDINFILFEKAFAITFDKPFAITFE